MKITVEVEALLKALTDVQGIVERKTLNPILSNVMLTAKDSNLTLAATDMNLYISKTINTEIATEGVTTVPLFQLLETIRKLKAKDKINLMLKDKHLSLECNGFKGNLPFLPASDFPENYKGTFNNTFNISSDSLKFLINKTRFAICLDETRYYLNGIYLHQEKNEEGNPILKAVATDGHKLALATTDLPKGVENLKGIIIPKKAVEELHKILEKLEDCSVKVNISNNLIVFNFPNLNLSSNLIDGTFPDYNKVIPETIGTSIAVNNKELISAIDLVSTFSDDKIRAVKLQVSGTLLTVKAAKENGLYSGEQSITLKTPHEEFLVGFNSRYLLEILNLIEKEEAYINVSTNTAPVLINNKENNNYLFVLMPMRT